MGFPVWFVCKLCKGTYGTINEFIAHKLEKHFVDYKQTRCIIFEEAADVTLLIPTFSATPAYFFLKPESTSHITNKSCSVTENAVNLLPAHGDGQQPCEFLFQPDTVSSTLNSDHSSYSTRNTNILVGNAENSSDFSHVDVLPQAGPSQDKSITDGGYKNMGFSSNEFMHDTQNSILEVSIKPDIELNSGSKFIDLKIQNQDLKDNTPRPQECSSFGKGKNLAIVDSSESSKIKTQTHLQCDICKKSFDSEPLLKIHVTICELYNSKKVTTEAEIESKSNSKSNKKTNSIGIYKCSECFKEFLCRQSLCKHKMKHNDGRFKCLNRGCSQAYTTQKYLDRHSSRCKSLYKNTKANF